MLLVVCMILLSALIALSSHVVMLVIIPWCTVQDGIEALKLRACAQGLLTYAITTVCYDDAFFNKLSQKNELSECCDWLTTYGACNTSESWIFWAFDSATMHLVITGNIVSLKGGCMHIKGEWKIATLSDEVGNQKRTATCVRMDLF